MTNNGTPSANVLRMYLFLMLSGKKYAQKELADKFDCSAQAIGRYADAIASVVGTNFIDEKKSRHRYYQITSGKPCTLGLDFEELHYLSLCRDLAGPTLPDATRKRIDVTLRDLSMRMAGSSHNSNHLEPQFAFFTKGRIDYTPHENTIQTLLKASTEKRICLIQYRANSTSPVKSHIFAPIRMASMSNALYVLGAGMADDFKTIRHPTNLAIHRIVEARLTEHLFEIDYPEASACTFGLPWHEPKTFTIHFVPKVADYIRERIWADEQYMEDLEDGGVTLTITTRSEPELMAWVRSFGDDARIDW
jgi:predicted DNA-binding transcriptional regulator YafY